MEEITESFKRGFWLVNRFWQILLVATNWYKVAERFDWVDMDVDKSRMGRN